MPTSFQAPMQGSKDKSERTYSQTTATNTSKGNATVSKLLEGKGEAIYSISPDDSIKTAVEVLSEKGIGALVVTNAQGGLEGILSERDIVRKLAQTPGQTLPKHVDEIMTRNVITCGPTDSLVSVLRDMIQGRFRHMPVVEAGSLKGMITIGDVVHFRLNEVEHEALQLKQMIVG